MRRAFTLVELLVVIVIIGILAVVAFPLMDRLTRVTQGGAGTSAVESAVNTARIVNSRLAHPKTTRFIFPDPDPTQPAIVREAEYAGSAVLFTPSGEMRIIWHDPSAEYASPSDPTLPLLAQWDDAGYVDVPQLDYLRIPRASYFAGVQWNNGSPQFIPPPFVVRFDGSGRMHPPRSVNDAIVYDGDGGGFGSQGGHPSGYEPREWDHRDPDATERRTTSDGRSELPADIIPVVSAVVLFESRQFREQGIAWANPNDFMTDPEFVRSVYFSPQTGRMMRGLSERR